MPGILDMPQYDWRSQIANLVKAAAAGYQPAATAAPTIYTPGAAVAAPAAAVAGVGRGHFVQPDYSSLIEGDPGYQQVASSASAARNTAARSRADSIRRALVQFGMAPAGYQSRYGDVDGATAAAAASNPTSTLRQLQDSRSRGSADLAASLGARGMLSSGALTGGEQLLQRNFDQSQQQATQSLLDALGGYEAGYANTEQQLEAQRQAAYGDAGTRVASLYPATWQSDEPVTPVNQGVPISYSDLGIDTTGQTIFGGGGANVGGMIDAPWNPEVGGVISDTLAGMTPDITSGPSSPYQPPPVVKPVVVKPPPPPLRIPKRVSGTLPRGILRR